MVMVAAALANALKNGLGFAAQPTSSETTGLATSIISHLSSGTVSHASVTGTAPPSGGPLTLGAAAGGTISGLSGSSLATLMKNNMGKPSVTPELQGMANGIANHLSTGLVTFLVGSIIGTCANTPVNPGPLAGSGLGGTISGLSGSTMATAMASAMGKPGTTPELIDFCTAIVNYVQTNASVTYATGAVTGVCSAGGGPVVAAGAGGTIL